MPEQVIAAYLAYLAYLADLSPIWVESVISAGAAGYEVHRTEERDPDGVITVCTARLAPVIAWVKVSWGSGEGRLSALVSVTDDDVGCPLEELAWQQITCPPVVSKPRPAMTLRALADRLLCGCEAQTDHDLWLRVQHAQACREDQLAAIRRARRDGQPLQAAP